LSSENLLRLLTIFDLSEEAEVLINSLRNAGFIVRDVRVEDDEDMLTALDDNPIDIILCKHTLPIFNAAAAAEIISKSGRDLPLIVITPKSDDSLTIECLKFGARDVINFENTQHLRHVLTRELSDLKERRAHRRCEKMLHETEKRSRSLIDNSRDAIAYVHEGMHIYVNNAYLMMFGYEELDDVEGMPILDMVSPDDHALLKDFLRAYSKSQLDEDTLNLHGQHTDGNAFDIVMEFSPASMEGEACTQIIIRDQADSKELEEKLNVLSKQDLITGLYNKTYLIEQLDKFISSALEGHARGALLYITLDNYDELKDSFGIAGLDMLFVDLASLLKDKLEKLGVFARMEGIAFCLLLKDADSAQAEKYAEGICTIVKSHISEINHKSVSSTTSIGITLINEKISNIHDCINRAEKGASIALENGGDQHHTYNPSIEDIEEHAKNSHWEKQIKFALKNNLFRLLFQPIVSLHGEPGAHYEIFVRMLDEDQQEIAPEDFIPAAEQAELMSFIDRWVIANSLLVLSERMQKKEETRLFIKISSSTIVDPDFLSWVSERIKALRINADFITFQVKEETALNYLKATKALFEGLKSLHFRTALDNFGVEENTFQSIKHFDVNYIKVHYDIISKLATNVEMQEQVKMIAGEVSKKNIQTIAAFVEDANCLALLWQCSVDFIQGYFLQEPDVVLEYDFEESF